MSDFDPTRSYFPGCKVVELAKFEPLLGPWPATVNRSLVDIVASIAQTSPLITPAPRDGLATSDGGCLSTPPAVAFSPDDCDPHGIPRTALAELPTWGARRHTGRGRLQIIHTIRPSDGTSPAATRPAAGEYGRTPS